MRSVFGSSARLGLDGFMRSLISLALSLALVAASFAEGWLLKAPYEAKTTMTWNVTLNSNVGGQDIESKMKQFLSIDSRTEKQVVGKVGWSDIEVNGNTTGYEPPPWDIVLTSNGSIESAAGGPEFVRQLAPTTFLYPNKEVEVGDKWTARFRAASDAKEIAAEYEVVELSKVGDTEALKIRGKLSEEGGLQSEGFYWLAKDGKLLKFDLEVKQWPMAGTEIPPLDAKLKGELVK